jgi:hypothetical protein
MWPRASLSRYPVCPNSLLTSHRRICRSPWLRATTGTDLVKTLQPQNLVSCRRTQLRQGQLVSERRSSR